MKILPAAKVMTDAVFLCLVVGSPIDGLGQAHWERQTILKCASWPWGLRASMQTGGWWPNIENAETAFKVSDGSDSSIP